MPNRAHIMSQISGSIFTAYFSKTLTYKESEEIRAYMRDKFSLEHLLGFKQLSIFDDVSDELFKDN